MAFTQDAANTGTRAYSIGPIKQVVISGTVATTDTSITITAAPLAELRGVVVSGVILAAAPTYSGNTATITFIAPGAGAGYIQVLAHGV